MIYVYVTNFLLDEDHILWIIDELIMKYEQLYRISIRYRSYAVPLHLYISWLLAVDFCYIRSSTCD